MVPLSDAPYSTVTDLARFRGKSTCKRKKKKAKLERLYRFRADKGVSMRKLFLFIQTRKHYAY